MREKSCPACVCPCGCGEASSYVYGTRTPKYRPGHRQRLSSGAFVQSNDAIARGWMPDGDLAAAQACWASTEKLADG